MKGHTTSITQRNLPNRPRRIVTRTNEFHLGLRIQLHNQILHHRLHMRPQKRETRHGQIANERVCALPDRRLRVLQANLQQLEEVRVAVVDEGLEFHAEALGEPREEIERDDEEGLVGLVEFGILLVHLVGHDGGFGDHEAAVEYGAGVREEGGPHCDRHRCETLHHTEPINLLQ